MFIKEIKKDIPKWLNILKNIPDYEMMKKNHIELSIQLSEQQLQIHQQQKNNKILGWILVIFFLLLCMQLFIMIINN